MSVFDKARVLIYRFHEKGLEIFLVNSDLQNDPDVWRIPKGQIENVKKQQELIELDPISDDKGEEFRLYAVEGDWHNIPSIRGLVKHDIKVAKKTIKELVPGIEKGAFFAVKEVVKHTMPNEYQAVKELKDILFDRNTVKNI